MEKERRTTEEGKRGKREKKECPRGREWKLVAVRNT